MSADRMTTYKMADGSEVFGEYTFVTDLDGWFDDIDEPTELVAEVWVRESVRTFWQTPSLSFTCCAHEDCGEGADDWYARVGQPPVPLCSEHAP